MSALADRRRWPALALVAAVLLGGSLVGISRLSSDGPETAAPAPAGTPSALEGVPQDGPVLGDPRAPVTIVEYADLQCPYCAEWTRNALPSIVDRYVRPGQVRVVFRGLAFLGPDSDKALRAVVAAGSRDRLWHLAEGLFLRQGPENSGWVTDELLTELGGGNLGSADARWIDSRIRRAADAARAAGVPGTPAFQVGRTGGRLELVQPSSLGPDGLDDAIESALRA